MYNLINKFKELDKSIKQIMILGIIVVLLCIGTVILRNLSDRTRFKINYKKIESASDLINYGVLIDDRILYWELKNIIYDFLYTMEDENIVEGVIKKTDTTYEQYYDVLTRKYRKYLDEKQYTQKAQSFINKFLLEDHLGYKYVDEFVIEKIYRFNNDMFLCMLKGSNTLQTGYIGIEINERETEFNIFYIE